MTDVVTLLNAVSANATGASIDAGGLKNLAAVQVQTAGTVSAFSVQVQASIDSTNWVSLGSAVTSATAETVLSGVLARYFRAVLSSYSGTGTVTVKLAVTTGMSASAGGGSGVTSVAASDTSIVVTAGSTAAPTVATGTLDAIATAHPPAAAWSNNSKKITSLANGSAASDVAAFGQIPIVWGPADQGYISWNYDGPGSTNGTAVALATAGTLYTCSVKLPVAASITNIATWISTAGSTLTSGQCFAALYQGAGGALLGVTADQAASWISTGLKTMAITGGPVAAAAGVLQVVFWFNGTTGPAMWRTDATLAFANAGLATANNRWGAANTGVTTTAPSTLATITGAGIAAIWAAVS